MAPTALWLYGSSLTKTSILFLLYCSNEQGNVTTSLPLFTSFPPSSQRAHVHPPPPSGTISRQELWGINTHGSGAFNTSELLLHSSSPIIDELFFPSHTTLRSIENNLILVFPPALFLPHYFLSKVASLWYKTTGSKRDVGGRCRGGAAEFSLKYAFFTWRNFFFLFFFTWQNYTQIRNMQRVVL